MPSPSSPPSSHSSINKNKNTQKRNSFSSAVNAINSQLGASAAAATAVDKNPKKQPQQRKPQSNTGRLRQLPPLQPATEILSRSQRLTYQTIKDDTKIANVRRRTQKRGAQTIDLLCQKLCSPLKHTVQTYERELKYMHPFEKVIMELTIRSRQKKDGLSLSTLLHDIHQGRKELLSLTKDWIYKIKNAQSARESYEFTEEAKELLSKVFLDLIQESWSGIAELQKSLRDVPIVRLDCPAVVLVGAPNVGKSSIVRAISSGTPEVNNYPFTTRGMTLGHVQVFWESEEDVAIGNVAGVSIPSERDLVQEKLERRGIKTRRMMKMMMEEGEGEKMMMRDEFADVKNVNDIEEGGDSGNYGRMNEVVTSVVDASDGTGNLEIEAINSIESTISKRSFAVSQLCQIMDSPGLLRRDNTEIRNEMEELTLAAMSHLPTAVMYVMDLSGGAGDKCSSVEDQLILRREVRARFPRRPWIDVISKVDLGIVDGARERLTEIMETERLEKAKKGIDCDEEHYFIELSIKEGKGVEELRQEVMRMLGEVRVVLDAMAKMDERSDRV
jgi:GTP1/Obg family GTP-binding protein